jgi:RNA polymerase-binding protein DksA
MPDAAYAPLRAQLQEERERLREQLAQMDVGSDNLDGNFADSSQVTAERGELEALAGTLSDTLQEIEHALAKLDAGTYGVCEECGGPIAEARLEAKPAARLCITCASKRR